MVTINLKAVSLKTNTIFKYIEITKGVSYFDCL